MANPTVEEIPADTWTKIATAVQGGFVEPFQPTDNEWFQTYRLTGNTGPVTEGDETPERKILFPQDEIVSYVPIDIYVFHKRSTGRIGVAV